MEFNDDENPYAANARGLVSVREPRYYKEDVGLGEDEVTVVVGLNATSSTAVREGLDLVAVLDVSGSMQGDKLASIKKAMRYVIEKLTPIDRLSIVAFSGTATRHCPLRCVSSRARVDLTDIVDRLVVREGSNIEAGIDTALAVIAGRTTTSARTANVFLMSDGQQDRLTEARMPEPGKVPVYTFGFGKDADHQLLADVARKSPGGTFSSVPDAAIATGPFSQLLGGLLTVVAQDVRLALTPIWDDLDTMSVAPGTDYTQTTDGDTGVVTIKFGTLFSGETRKVAVNFTLVDTGFDEDYDARLAEAHPSYTAQGGVHRNIPADIAIHRNPNPSSSDPAAASRMAQAVLAEITARQQHAGAIGNARELADGKNLDEARRKMADAMNALRETEELDQKLVGKLRAELLQLLALMESQELYEEEGRPYGIVSQLSHGRQRCAAGDDARLFATPRMDAYLQQAKQFEKDPTARLPSADDDVSEEMAANPFPAFSAPIIFRLRAVTLSPQEIENLTRRAF